MVSGGTPRVSVESPLEGKVFDAQWPRLRMGGLPVGFPLKAARGCRLKRGHPDIRPNRPHTHTHSLGAS